MPRYLADFDPNSLRREKVNCLVVGSGIAGLVTALRAARKGPVLLITKDGISDGSTGRAQGGIAAALGVDDSPALHIRDTIQAGASLCDPEAVEIMVAEGPARIKELLGWGVPFDKAEGDLALTREGAHSRRRILHAGGDATGAVIEHTLVFRVAAEPAIEVREGHFLLDLMVSNGLIVGALVADRSDEPYIIESPAVVLATGGVGQLYPRTTNPPQATGDGIAAAYRAGAQVSDMEFIQFHPTVLYTPESSQAFLLSEALRGEGGILRNGKGEAFMASYHPLGDLAPRDVVSQSMFLEMNREGRDFLWLDVSHMDEDLFMKRFPTIYSHCLGAGLNPARDPLPVAPAAHYMMGGILTDVLGRTSVRGLFAVGETACTGVHGANRLASNSLLEGLVFASRLVTAMENLEGPLPARMPETAREWQDGVFASTNLQTRLLRLQRLMNKNVGIIRDQAGLTSAYRFVLHEQASCGISGLGRAFWEWQNLLTVAGLSIQAALSRQETRGAHYRSDFPESDERWCCRLVQHREKGMEMVAC